MPSLELCIIIIFLSRWGFGGGGEGEDEWRGSGTRVRCCESWQTLNFAMGWDKRLQANAFSRGKVCRLAEDCGPSARELHVGFDRNLGYFTCSVWCSTPVVWNGWKTIMILKYA